MAWGGMGRGGGFRLFFLLQGVVCFQSFGGMFCTRGFFFDKFNFFNDQLQFYDPYFLLVVVIKLFIYP